MFTIMSFAGDGIRRSNPSSNELGIPFGLALLYPFTILSNEIAAFLSLRNSLRGRLLWKGRKIAQPHWRWL